MPRQSVKYLERLYISQSLGRRPEKYRSATNGIETQQSQPIA